MKIIVSFFKSAQVHWTYFIIRFREAPVDKPSIIAKFACVCSVNQRDFPQGIGKTKKDAKTEAARNAFMIMLGINDDAQEEGKSII